MADKKKANAGAGIPDDLDKHARSLLEGAFRFFRDHFGGLSQDLAELDKEHEKAKERIRRGPRRTNGRIV